MLCRPSQSKVKLCTRCFDVCWFRNYDKNGRKASLKSQVGKMKMQSTAKNAAKLASSSEEEDDEEEEEEENDSSSTSSSEDEDPESDDEKDLKALESTCVICNKNTDQSEIMCCESEDCQKAYHASCLQGKSNFLLGESFFGPCCSDHQHVPSQMRKPSDVYIAKDICKVTSISYDQVPDDLLQLLPGHAMLVTERNDNGYVQIDTLMTDFNLKVNSTDSILLIMNIELILDVKLVARYTFVKCICKGKTWIIPYRCIRNGEFKVVIYISMT